MSRDIANVAVGYEGVFGLSMYKYRNHATPGLRGFDQAAR